MLSVGPADRDRRETVGKLCNLRVGQVESPGTAAESDADVRGEWFDNQTAGPPHRTRRQSQQVSQQADRTRSGSVAHGGTADKNAIRTTNACTSQRDRSVSCGVNDTAAFNIDSESCIGAMHPGDSNVPVDGTDDRCRCQQHTIIGGRSNLAAAGSHDRNRCRVRVCPGRTNLRRIADNHTLITGVRSVTAGARNLNRTVDRRDHCIRTVEKDAAIPKCSSSIRTRHRDRPGRRSAGR